MCTVWLNKKNFSPLQLTFKRVKQATMDAEAALLLKETIKHLQEGSAGWGAGSPVQYLWVVGIFAVH